MSTGLTGPRQRTLFNPGCKVWLEKEGCVQGDGFFQLLEYIKQTGSIAGAASAMGMSYRAAWGKIKRAEKDWSLSLVYTRVGGETGGGAVLTPEAKDLLTKFYRFRQEVDREVHTIFNQLFSD